MKTPLVTIDQEETKEIQEIFKTKKDLEFLSSLIPKSDSPLLARNLSEIKKCESEFNGWWEKISRKYKLKVVAAGRWQIDFKTNTIYLIEI